MFKEFIKDPLFLVFSISGVVKTKEDACPFHTYRKDLRPPKIEEKNFMNESSSSVIIVGVIYALNKPLKSPL